MNLKRALLLNLLVFNLTLKADYSEQLRPYFGEAMKRSLPTPLFLDLFAVDAWIEVKSTNTGPYYQPGYITGGTIYHDSAGTPVTEWKRADFSNFYNELFHAWWGNVFLKSEKYARERDELLNDSKLKAKYRRANPNSPDLAQEEAYSETVSFLIFSFYQTSSSDFDKLYYQTGTTVAPVSHSDRPGYTLDAESIFPDEDEYEWLFEKLFHRAAPKRP